MKTAHLVKDLQARLSSLLADPAFAEAREERAGRCQGGIEDALIRHNMAVSEEIRKLDASRAKGFVEAHKIAALRRCLASYMAANGTGHEGYDRYISIVTEYLALVAQKPLHPAAVRHLENNPPRDMDGNRYCAWKTRHLNDPFSLCRFCNCRPWPESG